ncbi:MAG: immune inhibitor A [candidate division Zixibacteria bacterium]|nr:immune inhibitor A [candidate division Zixibacteria bacterium]
MQVRVYFETKEQWGQLLKMNLDIVWRAEDYYEIIPGPDDMRKLETLGFKTEIVHENLTEYLQSRLAPDKAMGGYKTLSEINAYLDALIFDNANIMSPKVSIGQTLEGRDIWAFKISDNPKIDEDEPEVLYTAAIHAREVITPEVLFYFINYLLDNYGIISEVTEIVDNRELWFILVCNPDGYYHNEVTDPGGGGMWRKNRRNNGDGYYGVDLNRNWGYLWGLDDEGSSPYTYDETYRGTGPFSEPETQALRDFHLAHDFIISLYYHSYSNLCLWPWGYAVNTFTPDEDIFSQMGDTISAFNGYAPGTAAGLYPTNGASDDWLYGEQTAKAKSFAFTMEVGSYSDNFWPPTSRIQALISENLQPNLFLARIAGDVYSLRAPSAPTLILPDTVPNTAYEVVWSHNDTLNPAVMFELAEMQGYQVKTDSADNFDNFNNNGFTTTTARFHTAPTSFYSGLDSDLDNYFTTTTPYLVQENDTLRFWTWYDIETDWDYAYVEISTNGATYVTLPGNITDTTNLHGNNRGDGITGASGGWVEGLFDLAAYVGENVFIRISYVTDSYVEEEGFYIDDISPVALYESITVVSSTITDTSYAFTDKPIGTYYYKVRAKDLQNQWGAFSSVVEVFVAEGQQYVCGDPNGDENVNLLDVLYLIDHLYSEPIGPAPIPAEAGDPNADGNINLLDVLYLIDYLYGTPTGPEPLCP